jgi:hypothetical protein
VRGVYVYIAERDRNYGGVHGDPANKLFFVDPLDGFPDEICEITGSFGFNGDIVYNNNDASDDAKVYVASSGQRWGVLDFEEDNLNICLSYKEFSGAYSNSLQLAVNKAGELIGNDISPSQHDTWYKMTGDFDLVDNPPALLEAVPLFNPSNLGPGRDYEFTDLASGTKWTRSETAWADGAHFLGKNWATYIEVGKTPECVPDECLRC